MLRWLPSRTPSRRSPSTGVALSEATVKSGEYALQRPFVLVTRTNETLSDSAQKFSDYMTSSDASDIIAAAGAVSAN